MAANNISQIDFFSVIFKTELSEFSPCVEITEINGLHTKMAACQLKVKWACTPMIYDGRKSLNIHVSCCVVCVLLPFLQTDAFSKSS